MPIDRRPFPTRLRDRREAAGYTQEELGALCDWTGGRISRLERDAWRPRRETVATIAAALSCLPSDLDPEWTIEVPDGAVVLRPDPDVERAYRPWRPSDAEHVDGSIDCDELGPLTDRLRELGLALYLLP